MSQKFCRKPDIVRRIENGFPFIDGPDSARITQRGTAMRDAKDKLIGTWKIVSAVMEDVETKEQKLVWGMRILVAK
jgi:hypothetical protein